MHYGTEMNASQFGIKYAGTVTAQAEAYSNRRLVSSWTF